MIERIRNLAGKPREGIHASRIPYLDLAANDVYMTILLAAIIAVLFKKKFICVVLILFLISILSHRIFKVNTTINKFIFGVMC